MLASMIHWPTSGSILGHRLWRWPSIEPALGQCDFLVFAGELKPIRTEEILRFVCREAQAVLNPLALSTTLVVLNLFLLVDYITIIGNKMHLLTSRFANGNWSQIKQIYDLFPPTWSCVSIINFKKFYNLVACPQYSNSGWMIRQPFARKVIWLQFSPTWSCVSLPRPTTWSRWKLLIFVQFETTKVQMLMLTHIFYPQCQWFNRLIKQD